MQVTLSIRAVPNVLKKDRIYYTTFTNHYECDFRDLVNMLQKDFIFSPFNYLGYMGGTFNICSDAQFVIIDVDSTSISIHERLQQLTDEGLTCIIGTTSDTANMYKYRVLIPLSKPIDSNTYRSVVTGIRVYGLIADMDVASAKPAQKFYSYANSLVVSNFNGKPLEVDDYLVDISTPEYRSTSHTEDIADILHEFDSYRYATKGKRTRSLLSAGYRCIEYGLSDAQMKQVIYYVNNLFIVPKPLNEIDRRVINFIKQQRN